MGHFRPTFLLQFGYAYRSIFLHGAFCYTVHSPHSHSGILSLIEVLGPYDFPVVWNDDDNDASQDAANFFTALGAAGLVVYIGVDFLPKKYFPELWQLISGFLALSIGTLSAFVCSLFQTNKS